MIRLSLFLLFFFCIGLVQAQELALVRTDKNFGYLNREEEYAIVPQFVQAHSFLEDLACVYDGLLWGYIDRQGKSSDSLYV
ncbi:WG repeat-containing protein [Myroides sp. DW712]|uniref:WG repeat-containing protein n=1 Tax=Myroides sp. DW712 TaxID=3389800 RepID=UPI00397D3BA4